MSLKELYSKFIIRGRYEYWFYGDVIGIYTGVISIIFLTILCILTNRFTTLSWKAWLPVIVCAPIMIFGFLMSLLPNGTGGVTQHVYLAIFSYALGVLFLTGIGEIIIIIARKLFFK